MRVRYLIGMISNNRLQEQTAALLDEAVAGFERTGTKQRLFTSFGYQAESWDKQRRVIAKAECMVQGTNLRFVVTNLPGDPQMLYDRIYAHRGEMENRIKELKNGLAADRLSCHRFLANQFHLLLHTFAYCLLWFLREHLARTPFSTAQVDTLRLHLLKIGTRVVKTTRRIWLHLASGYLWRELLLKNWSRPFGGLAWMTNEQTRTVTDRQIGGASPFFAGKRWDDSSVVTPHE